MIAIIDYGMGNLRSVQKAVERSGAEAVITDSPDIISAASKIILPGVGAFGDAVAELEHRRLIKPILKAIESGKHFLGICLGLQLLFETGYENGEHKGLGVFRGDVVRFELPRELTVPHIGWNQVRLECPNPLFSGIADESYFYFVHSYYVAPRDTEIISGTTEYGVRFCSAVRQDKVFAVQFHPEKSQAVGLKMISNFVAANRG